ncbi:MAG: PepSY domain-containing protein, partial [Silvanigrellaceae bacterium]
MRSFLSVLNLSSLMALTACSFQGAGNKNNVQTKANGSSENTLMQGLVGKRRASTTAPWLESVSRRKETPESYKRAIDRAFGHIKAKQDSMLTNPDLSFSVQTVIMNEAGEETVRFESIYNGRRVIGGDVVVQSHSDGNLKKIEKNLQKEIKLSASGLITPEKAHDIAHGVFTGELHESVEPEAIIYAMGGEPKEAFEVVLKGSHGSSQHPSELHVFVDALTGEVINKWDAICEGTEKEAADAIAPVAAQSVTQLSLTSSGNEVVGTNIFPPEQTFRLQSKPTASKVIYLDFDGHTTTGTSWNNTTMGSSFYSPAWDLDGDPSSFSASELNTIQAIWQQVSQRFSTFDVNVTTMEPPKDWLIRSGSTDPNFGVRAVFTSFGPSSSSSAGIAHVSNFNFDVDDPVFIYARGSIGAKTASHEIGHSLGLSHDGVSGFEYYAGHGVGIVSWAPVMGSSSNTMHVVQWDDGTYYNSTNTGIAANYNKGAGDLEVITGFNGFGFNFDLVGNSINTATPLAISSGSVAQFGSIETRMDSDWFSFQLTTSGDLNLTFDPYWYRAYVDDDGAWGGSASGVVGPVRDNIPSTNFVENGSTLDLSVELFDSNGKRIATSDESGLVTHLFAQGLNAGTYYLKLDGVGFGDPTSSTPTGWSDYGSIGNYWISGTINGAADPAPVPAISVALAADSALEDSSSQLLFTFTRSIVTSDPLTVNYTVSGTASNGSDYTGILSGSSQSVTFASGASTATVVVDPTSDSSMEMDETVILSLVAGTGYSVGTPLSVVGLILNDDVGSSLMRFTSGVDTLTGNTNSNTFQLLSVGESLWSGTPDRITNLNISTDSIDTPSTRTNAITPKVLGAVKTLDAAGIAALLTSRSFPKNTAATFTFNSGSGVRTFLAINDG